MYITKKKNLNQKGNPCKSTILNIASPSHFVSLRKLSLIWSEGISTHFSIDYIPHMLGGDSSSDSMLLRFTSIMPSLLLFVSTSAISNDM